ncbi:glycoside hydrolase family 2 sugar binding protein [Russula earlei]|uniref:Glycoside hydrolase family 2 sugar binding protein n=1 Tax=Russula earlei TaxID=71964 RepID=A0ACC0TQ08_9AGAM|nr:glycoside hydrolase family 2 sugar binding protein [Russula earlei]
MAVAFAISIIAVQAQQARTITPFDTNWKFSKGDANNAEQVSFSDAQWRTLDVPHDWSIEGPYDRGNPTGRGGGYLPAGIGWYRKIFTLEEADAKKLVFIEFDGVMANSEVWINGYHLGKRPNGYISFQYELTGHLNFGKGKTNILAVKADNSIQPSSRWYTGSGIYRHVRLITTGNIHVIYGGSYVTTSDITPGKATVHIQTTVTSELTGKQQNATIQTSITAPDGKTVASTETPQKIAGDANTAIAQQLNVTNPVLWDLDAPQLYKVVTKIIVDKKVVDEITTPFGIRTAVFEAATGFWLNGKNLKIKGVCLHHDGGAVGAAVPLSVWKRRFQLLKEAGVNGIRTSHAEESPEFLTLCDQMGLLVMDETFDTWEVKKSSAENGYNLNFKNWWEKDTRDIVMRDRNHPSVVIYSVGNEIHDNLNDSSGFHKYKMQQDLIHSLDPTRPVTMALFRPAISHAYENGLAEMMDVVGQNYRENELIAAHEAKPERKVIGTENTHVLSQWLALRDKPYMSGQFLWTGFDYLGEADWPKVVNGQGLYDRTGTPRAVAFQRESWWSDKPMVYVMRREQNAGAGDWISDWTPTDIDTYDEARIQVFSNCDEVELFLNDKSQGVKPRTSDNASPRTWSFPYEKGTLKAVARNSGKVVAEQELKTAGKPAKVVLSVDKRAIENNWDDVAYITATITDENGIPCLTADNKITFNITGAGVIAAVDNGDLSSAEPFIAKERWAYKGRCIAIIKANANSGKITVTATADGLKDGTATVEVKQ